jgi:hypothetical protein
MVGIIFAASYDKSKLPGCFPHGVGQCEGGLPDSYGMKAEEMAALMNSF